MTRTTKKVRTNQALFGQPRNFQRQYFMEAMDINHPQPLPIPARIELATKPAPSVIPAPAPVPTPRSSGMFDSLFEDFVLVTNLEKIGYVKVMVPAVQQGEFKILLRALFGTTELSFAVKKGGKGKVFVSRPDGGLVHFFDRFPVSGIDERDRSFFYDVYDRIRQVLIGLLEAL